MGGWADGCDLKGRQADRSLTRTHIAPPLLCSYTPELLSLIVVPTIPLSMLMIYAMAALVYGFVSSSNGSDSRVE
jgi:hypothetical protein